MKKVMCMILVCVFTYGVAYGAEDAGKGVSMDLSINCRKKGDGSIIRE